MVLLPALAASVWQKRRISAFYSQFVHQLCYVRASAARVRAYNSVQTLRMLFMAVNLTSLLLCVCLSGSQYAKALHVYYLKPIEGEADLMARNLGAI